MPHFSYGKTTKQVSGKTFVLIFCGAFLCFGLLMYFLPDASNTSKEELEQLHRTALWMICCAGFGTALSLVHFIKSFLK